MATEQKVPTPTKAPKVEYVPFQDLKKDEIQKLDTVPVKLQKNSHKKFGESATIIVEFEPRFKKQIRNPQIIDMRKYELILASRSELNRDDDVHIMNLPVRFYQRHNRDGEIEYKRFEIAFTRSIIIRDFFDYTDQQLIDILKLNFNFKEDKDSTKEFESVTKEVDYNYFA